MNPESNFCHVMQYERAPMNRSSIHVWVKFLILNVKSDASLLLLDKLRK